MIRRRTKTKKLFVLMDDRHLSPELVDGSTLLFNTATAAYLYARTIEDIEYRVKPVKVTFEIDLEGV